MTNRYIDEFLKMKSCADILDIVSPLKNPEKEITESMSLLLRIKNKILSDPMRYNIIDLCAGNALTSLISVFRFPVERAVAIDKTERERAYFKARRFEYIEMDIFDPKILNYIDKDTIIISVHACRELAEKIIDIYKNSTSRHLCMIPCCEGKFNITAKEFLRKKLGNYLTWSYYLANRVNGTIVVDKNCLSERNAIISAHKSEI